MEGKWLTVLEYAAYRNKSISTVRRYIKGDRVKFRDDNGKYYIWAPNYYKKENELEKQDLANKLEVDELKKEVRELKEENQELKMLVEIYEKKLNKLPEPPSLPELS